MYTLVFENGYMVVDKYNQNEEVTATLIVNNGTGAIIKNRYGVVTGKPDYYAKV